MQFVRNFLGAAGENQFRLAAWLVHHLYVQPPHPRPPAGSQRLERGFLGGEPGRVTLRPILELVAISDFRRSKNLLRESLTVPLETLLDAGSLCDIHPGSTDHCQNVRAPAMPASVMREQEKVRK